MKDFLRTYKDILIINLVFLIVAILLYFLFEKKIGILGAVVAVGISFSIGFVQYRIQNDVIFKELFIYFTSKYDKEYNGILNGIVDKTQVVEDYRLTDSEKDIVTDFINFCAEEYLWYSKNRIPNNVWHAWQEGMAYFFKCNPIKQQLLSEYSQASSYYGFLNYMREKVNILN